MEGLEPNPMNPNIHHHDELWDRTPVELRDYYAARNHPTASETETEKWYKQCIKNRYSRTTKFTINYKKLNRSKLEEKIRTNSGGVLFFGGASFTLSEYLMKHDVGKYVDFCTQAVCSYVSFTDMLRVLTNGHLQCVKEGTRCLNGNPTNMFVLCFLGLMHSD